MKVSFVPFKLVNGNKYIYLAKDNCFVIPDNNLFKDLTNTNNPNSFSFKNKDFDSFDSTLNDMLFYTSKPNEHKSLEQFNDYLEQETDVTKLTIEITRECTLSCSYCGVCHPQDKEKYSFDDFEIFLKSLKINGVKKVSVSFYGGKPLLYYSRIEKFCELLTKKFYITNFSMTTNLTILNESIINILRKYSINILISLDGYEEIHNSNRKTLSGKGSHKLILENLEKLFYKYKYSRFKFNCVITPKTDLALLKHFFLNLLQRLNISKELSEDLVTLSFVSQNGRYRLNQDENSELSDIYSNLLKNIELNILSDIEEETSFPIVKILWGRRLKNYLNLLDRVSKPTLSNICKCKDSSNIFITYDGLVSICNYLSEQNLYLGDLFEGKSDLALNNFYSRNFNAALKCETCWAKKFCSMCPRDILYSKNDNDPSIKCSFERELVYYLLKCILYFKDSSNIQSLHRYLS